MLDDKDFRILNLLLQNSKQTTRQLAKKTQIPITTVHHRIKQLTQKGVIKKYTVELDYEKTGESFAAYILIFADLNLLKTHKRTQKDIVNDLKKLYQVKQAMIITGTADIIAFVRAKDAKEFNEVLLEKIHQVVGVSKTQSMIVI